MASERPAFHMVAEDLLEDEVECGRPCKRHKPNESGVVPPSAGLQVFYAASHMNGMSDTPDAGSVDAGACGVLDNSVYDAVPHAALGKTDSDACEGAVAAVLDGENAIDEDTAGDGITNGVYADMNVMRCAPGLHETHDVFDALDKSVSHSPPDTNVSCGASGSGETCAASAAHLVSFRDELDADCMVLSCTAPAVLPHRHSSGTSVDDAVSVSSDDDSSCIVDSPVGKHCHTIPDSPDPCLPSKARTPIGQSAFVTIVDSPDKRASGQDDTSHIDSSSSDDEGPTLPRGHGFGPQKRDGSGGRFGSLRLTQEQEHVVALALSPEQLAMRLQSCVVRITSGAGTGKTTTLQALAVQLHRLGHRRVLYCTFNRSAERDAAIRFQSLGLGSAVSSKTVHGCAWGLMGAAEAGNPLDEHALEPKCAKLCEGLIDEMLAGLPGRSAGVRRRIAFFIRKTLEGFLQSDRTEEEGLGDAYHTYYPAKKFHEDPPKGVPRAFGDFYVKCARRVWGRMQIGAAPAFISYDSVLKQAQLQKRQLPCTALLVDEAQDLNKCQIAWLASQDRAQVFFVGDPVQTIYSFRGAKSKFLSELPGAIDRALTASFRFGPAIGAAANTILFAKAHSPQTDWLPYRLRARGAHRGLVTSAGLLDGRLGPVTLLARANAELLVQALECLALRPGVRIAINGDGENSGLQKWRGLLNEIGAVFELYKGRATRVPFAEFAGAELNWEAFVKEARDRELGKFYPHVALIERYGDATLTQIARFEREIMQRPHAPDTADVLLSTVHAAKGQEWAHVQLCDDFADLALFRVAAADAGPAPRFAAARGPGAGPAPARTAQFDWRAWGDDYHLWYVAVTRARRTLAVPKKFVALVGGFVAGGGGVRGRC